MQIKTGKIRRNPMTDKRADLAGPGIGNYDDLEKNLPEDYEPLIPPKERMKAIHAIKNYIEENLCKELNLQMVQVPLIVDRDSGVNDYLDRDGSRTPVEFPCGLGLDKPIQAQVVQAATKWKRTQSGNVWLSNSLAAVSVRAYVPT
jgi:aspartate--ammonia ligase